MNYSNSAERLYNILLEISKSKHNVTWGVAWSEMFNIDPQDTSAIFYVIVDVISLIKETRAKLLSIPDIDDEIIVDTFKVLESGFSNISLKSDINRLKDTLDKSTLNNLRLCKEIMKQTTEKHSIDEQELDLLRKEVEELSGKIGTSSLPQDLKIILIEKLDLIRKAIVDIRIKGVEALQHIIESSLGSAMLNHEIITQNNNDENIKGFFGLLGKVHKAITVGKDSADMIASATKLFIQ